MDTSVSTLYDVIKNDTGKIVAVEWDERRVRVATQLADKGNAGPYLTPVALLELTSVLLTTNVPSGSTNAVCDRLRDAIGILLAEQEREQYQLQKNNKD